MPSCLADEPEASPEQQQRMIQHQLAVQHVMKTVDPACAEEVKSQDAAARAGDTPPELSPECAQAVQTEYLAYATENGFDMGQGAGEDAAAAAPPAEPVDSLPTLLLFLALVGALVAAVVVTVMQQAAKSDTEEARAARAKKLKSLEKKKRKGKLKDQ